MKPVSRWWNTPLRVHWWRPVRLAHSPPWVPTSSTRSPRSPGSSTVDPGTCAGRSATGPDPRFPPGRTDMSAPETAAPLTLLAMLVIASQSDLRQHRIPNVVSLAGLIAGLALHALADGLHGMLSGLAGAAVGLLCFAPFYLLRGMGGGDVKLLAAAGG